MHIDVLIDMWALSAVDGPIIVGESGANGTLFF